MKKNPESPLVKKQREFPHSIAILCALILLSVILTWIVPAGQFERVIDPNTGREIVKAGTFQYVDQNPIGIMGMFESVSSGMQAAGSVVFMVLIIGGAFEIINHTGALTAFLAQAAHKFRDKGIIMVPIATLVFSVMGCIMSLSEIYIAFAPLGVVFARALGFDAIVGIAIVILGMYVGFTSGEFNAFSTGTAQGIIGLPSFSGLEYRIAMHVVVYLITVFFIYRYASMIRKDFTKSFCYEVEMKAREKQQEAAEVEKLTGHHIAVLLILLAGFVGIVYGALNGGDSMAQIPAIFLIMALVTGIISRYSVNQMCELFIKGAGGMLVGALIVGFARAISLVLTKGIIIDTIVYGASTIFMGMPKGIAAVFMFLFQSLMNCFIISGSGQATATIPIMSPIGDILGLPQQLVVIAFQFGDGITNMVLPTAACIMAPLAFEGVSYKAWLRFVWKIILFLSIAAAVMVFAMSYMNIGPF